MRVYSIGQAKAESKPDPCVDQHLWRNGGILSHVRLDNQQNRDNSPVGIPIPIRTQQRAGRTKREQGEFQGRAAMART